MIFTYSRSIYSKKVKCVSDFFLLAFLSNIKQNNKREVNSIIVFKCFTATTANFLSVSVCLKTITLLSLKRNRRALLNLRPVKK